MSELVKEATENGAAAESEKEQMNTVEDGVDPETTKNGAAPGEPVKEQMNKVEDGMDLDATENGAATGVSVKEKPNKVEDGVDPEATDNRPAREQPLKEQVNKVENRVDAEATENGALTEDFIMNKVEGVVDLEATEKSEGLVNAQERPKKRKWNMQVQTLSAPESNEKQIGQAGLAGLIFMCSAETKKDCFKYGVFGFPIERKDLVEQVKKGMKLFLFDIDWRLLYGVYRACSEGGTDLEPEAFKRSKRKFPAQVRFCIHKECFPLEEADFKQAIKENYSRGKNRFNCQLDVEQVGKLMQLFRPLDGEGLPEPKSKPARFARDAMRKPRHIQARQYISPPRSRKEPVYLVGYQSPYGREHLDPQLHRQLSYVPSSQVTLAEAEAIYQQKLQDAHWDALRRAFAASDPIGAHVPKRYMDELYREQLDTMAGLPNPFFRGLEPQRDILPDRYGSLRLSGGVPY